MEVQRNSMSRKKISGAFKNESSILSHHQEQTHQSPFTIDFLWQLL
jgi:hypothetical protein